MSEEVTQTDPSSAPIEGAQQTPTHTEGFESSQQDSNPFANIQLTPSGVSKGELIEAARFELESGRLTLEQVNAMLAADGVEPINSPSSFDKAFPKLDLNQYQVGSLLGEGQDFNSMSPTEIQEVAQLGTLAQSWVAEARFPKESGSFVIQECVRTANHLEKMSDPQKQLWMQQQQKSLQDMYKGQFKENLALARKLVSELETKKPGLTRFLEESGVGNSAMVVNQFVIQARRLYESQKHF